MIHKESKFYNKEKSSGSVQCMGIPDQLMDNLHRMTLDGMLTLLDKHIVTVKTDLYYRFTLF